MGIDVFYTPNPKNFILQRLETDFSTCSGTLFIDEFVKLLLELSTFLTVLRTKIAGNRQKHRQSLCFFASFLLELRRLKSVVLSNR